MRIDRNQVAKLIVKTEDCLREFRDTEWDKLPEKFRKSVLLKYKYTINDVVDDLYAMYKYIDAIADMSKVNAAKIHFYYKTLVDYNEDTGVYWPKVDYVINYGDEEDKTVLVWYIDSVYNIGQYISNVGMNDQEMSIAAGELLVYTNCSANLRLGLYQLNGYGYKDTYGAVFKNTDYWRDLAS